MVVKETEGQAFPFSRQAMTISALVWCLIALAIWLLRGWKLHGLHAPWIEGASAEFPLQQIRAAGAFLLLNTACLGWGGLATCRFRLRLFHQRLVLLGLNLLVGHLITALLIFFIGIAGLLPWGMLVIFTGLLGVPRFFRDTAHLPKLPPPACSKHLVFWKILAATMLGLTFLAALAPVAESDGLRYHLFAPQEYLKHGAIDPLPWHAFTNLPFQTNMLYMAAMWMGGMRAPQLVHWTYLPLIMIFAGALGEQLIRTFRANRKNPKPCSPSPGALSIGVLATSAPVMMVLAGWPFVDLSTCAFLLASIWALCPGSLRRLDHRLLVSGIFTGAAIGTKLTAVITGGITGLVVLSILASRPHKFTRLLLFVLPAMLVPAPWLVKNIVHHGNPVYPAAYGLFGGPEWDRETDAFYKAKAAEKGFGKSPIDFALSPLDVTIRWANHTPPRGENLSTQGISRLTTPFSPGFEDQNPGPLLLALLPLGIGLLMWLMLRRLNSPIVALVFLQLVLGWIVWFFTYQSVRFMMPLIAFTAIAGAVGIHALLSNSQDVIPRFVSKLLSWIPAIIAMGGVAWYAIYLLFSSPTFPLQNATGLIREDQYLSLRLDYYDAVDWLNIETEANEKVFYIGEYRGLYAQYDAQLSDWFDVPRILSELRQTESNQALLEKWKTENIRFILYNLKELKLFASLYFFPRFNPEEVNRFEELHHLLLEKGNVVFEPREEIYVIDLQPIYATLNDPNAPATDRSEHPN